MQKWILLAVMSIAASISTTIADPLVFAISGIEEDTDSFRVAQSVASDIAQRCGTKISLTLIPYQRRNDLLLSGRIDGSFSDGNRYDEGIPGLIRIEQPVVRYSIFAFSKMKNLKVAGWKSLENYKVAYNSSSVIVKKKLASKKENTISFTHNAAALKFLVSGRADVFVGTRLSVEPLLERGDLKSSGIVALLPPLEVSYSYMYILGKHSKLATCFNIALRNANENKTYEKILN